MSRLGLFAWKHLSRSSLKSNYCPFDSEIRQLCWCCRRPTRHRHCNPSRRLARRFWERTCTDNRQPLPLLWCLKKPNAKIYIKQPFTFISGVSASNYWTFSAKSFPHRVMTENLWGLDLLPDLQAADYCPSATAKCPRWLCCRSRVGRTYFDPSTRCVRPCGACTCGSPPTRWTLQCVLCVRVRPSGSPLPALK